MGTKHNRGCCNCHPCNYSLSYCTNIQNIGIVLTILGSNVIRNAWKMMRIKENTKQWYFSDKNIWKVLLCANDA